MSTERPRKKARTQNDDDSLTLTSNEPNKQETVDDEIERIWFVRLWFSLLLLVSIFAPERVITSHELYA